MRDGRTVAMVADEDEGGRIFFTSTGRSLIVRPSRDGSP